MNKYLEIAKLDLDEMVKNRRYFHQHPELGFHETQTADYLANQLQGLGLEITTGVAKTGIVTRIKGDLEKPMGMLRFDMDALPIQEETGLVFSSQNQGVMHACGHDGHMAIGLAVCNLLKSTSNELEGSIRCIFQPAEEGDGGAAMMIREGVLENPQPDFVLGLHLWNEKPVGWVGVKSGPVMAASDVFEIRVIGKGGHGGNPTQIVDPIVCAAQIVSGLQTIPSRNLSAFEQAVISVTMISGGSAHNVVPDEVIIRGTIRTFEKSTQQKIHHRVTELAKNMAEAFGCRAEVMIQNVTSAVMNNEKIIRSVRKTIENGFSFLQMDTTYQTTISEDMALYLDQIPGCFILLGSANPEIGADYPHHHSKFNFDEGILPVAAGLMAECVKQLLTEFH